MRVGIKNFGIISPYGFSNQVWNKILNHEIDNTNIVSNNDINICSLNISVGDKKSDFKTLRRMDKQVIYLLKSVKNALSNGGIRIKDLSKYEKQKIGVFGGSMFAQAEFGYEQVKSLLKSKGENKKISMYTGLSFYYGAPTVETSILYQLQGENCTITSGSTSGSDCVIAAVDNIRRGINNIILSIAGENINIPSFSEMFLNNSFNHKWGMINTSNHYYSSGAICAIISKINEKNNCPIEIIASKTYVAEDCLFSFNNSFIETIEKVIYDCLDEAKLSTSNIDLILPSFNNVGNGDFFEVKALAKIFSGRKEIIYIPELIIGDMLSGSGLLKLFVAYKCIVTSTIPANKYGFRKNTVIDSIINKEIKKCTIKYVLILQKSFMGGKISAIILKKHK